MNKPVHDIYCEEQNVEYATSTCDSLCDYVINMKQECVAEGEHFKRTISEGGYDKCFNCGAKE